MTDTIKWKTAKWHDVNDVYNDGYSKELRRYSVCGYYVITTYGDRIWYLKELTSSYDDCDCYTKVWTYRDGDLQFKSLNSAKKYAEEITKGAKMNKQEIIEHLNQYVDQIVEQHKFKFFSRYVKSKKVQFVACSVAPNIEYTYMTGKTVTGGYTVEIFDRQGEREPQRMSCTCADWSHRLKKQQKPCKHIFAFVERYQSKRKYLLEKAWLIQQKKLKELNNQRRIE